MRRRLLGIGTVGFIGALVLFSFGFSAQAAGKQKFFGSNKSVKITISPSHKHSHKGQTQRTDKLTICHRTGSAGNSYREITVNSNALDAHKKHGDIVPAPLGGCPD